MAFDIPLYGPRWFNGIDCAFEIILVVTALSIWYFARKAKRLTDQPRLSTLANAFLLIALSFLIKIVTNLSTYLKLQDLGSVFWFSQAIQVQILFALGYFLYRLLFLVALIWLVCLGLEVIDWRLRVLLVIFAAVGTFFSQYSYIVFHLMTVVLLAYVVAIAYGHWREKKGFRTRTVAMAFLMILISQVVFLFVGWEPEMYVLGETIQLLGFAGLLYNQITLPKIKQSMENSMQQSNRAAKQGVKHSVKQGVR